MERGQHADTTSGSEISIVNPDAGATISPVLGAKVRDIDAASRLLDLHGIGENIVGQERSWLLSTVVEAVSTNNDPTDGLDAEVFTQDAGKALRLSKVGEFGNISIKELTSLDVWIAS